MPLWSRILNTLRGDRSSRETIEELEAHIADAIQSGRDPDEARRSLGSMLRLQEESRDVRILPWLDSLRADAIFGWRRLNKTKVSSAAAILSLALAIGACTATFRLVDALFLRPLPIANANRLHVVAFQGTMAPTGKPLVYDSSSYPMFERMRDAVKTQAELVAVSYADRTDVTFGSDQDMEKADMQYVSADMFSVFRLNPAMGRLLSGNDGPVSVISYDYWGRRFGRDPNAIGRTFRIGNDLFEIVGVAPKGFTGTETGTMTDIFLPMSMKNPRTLASYNNFWMRTLVLLKPGVDPNPVHEQLVAIYNRIQEERAKGSIMTPQALAHFFAEKLVLEPAVAGRSNLQRDYGESLTALAVLVALVLLIAVANVANLMTARAAARAREMALRVSIGAGRGHLIQLVLMESLLIACAATIGGALFAWWAAPMVANTINTRLALSADWRLFAFALALTLAVSFLFGLPSALRASSVIPASALKGGDDPHSRRRLMHGLIAVQVAFCFLVVFVAILFLSTFERLTHQPLGYSPERIVNLETVTRQPQAPVYWDQVAERLRSIPGVERVALAPWPLMSGETGVATISLNGTNPEDVFADRYSVSPGWFDTMKIRFLGGRDFRWSDSSPNVAVVNEAFAKQYFGGADPVGKYFTRLDTKTRVEIVGYVRDARYRDNLRLPIRPTFYPPLHAANANGELSPLNRATFVVRTSAVNPLVLAPALRQEVPRARPEFRVSNIRTQEEIIESKTIRERLLALLAVFFAIVALLLSGVGLYGVLDYSVLQQRREIGIRMAIGARGFDVARQVAWNTFAMVLLGAAAGLAFALASAQYLASLLFDVRASDPGMLILPSIILLAVALLACAPAVIRAVRIDPVATLRSE